jgi:hypothetical protein
VASSGRITSLSTFAIIITLEKVIFTSGGFTIANGVQNKIVLKLIPHPRYGDPAPSHHLKKGSNTCGKCTTTLTFTAHSLAATA